MSLLSFETPRFARLLRMRIKSVAAARTLILRSRAKRGVSKDALARFRPVAALAAFAFLSACGQKSVAPADVAVLTPAAQQSAPQPDAAGDTGPAMWLVSDEDSTVYLFGTFHILPASTNWTTGVFDAAMTETTTTITEVDAKSPEAQAKMAALVQELGLNPAGVTLTQTLGETRAARFAEIAGDYGVPMAALEPLRPWLAMITLSMAVMQKEGFESGAGAEETILSRAASEGDQVAYLESAEYQVRALAGLDEAEILADFDSSLDQFDDFGAYAARVLGAWASGDARTLEQETLAPMREASPAAFRTLITDRNSNWVREIDAIMAGDEDCFIAVGAGHLIGEDSVVDMLKEKGYAVRRVQ